MSERTAALAFMARIPTAALCDQTLGIPWNSAHTRARTDEQGQKMKLANQFEISRGSGSKPMEGLRGLAVTLVFFVHYVSLCEPWTGQQLTAFAAALKEIGNIGVDLFFTLSGYLIYDSLIRKRPALLQFLARRIQRIYPAFLAVFVAYVALSFAMPSESKLPNDGLAIYLLQQVLLMPGIFPITPMITVAWSLSYELAFYLAIPLVISALSLRRWSAWGRIGLWLSIAACTVALADGDHKRVAMFVSGILVSDAIRVAKAPDSMAANAALFLAIISPILPTTVTGYERLALLMASCFVLCWHCLTAQSMLTRAFSWTPLRWLGNMSYSYYLIHGLALKGFFLIAGKLVPQGAFFFALLLPAFVVTLLVAAILFLLIERPLSLQPVDRPSERQPVISEQAGT
jgi:exopolysaccharide production protein ExoZ